jgi:chitodextrinase
MIPVGVIAQGGVTVPTVPQSFTATAISSTQINLSWAAPATNGGAAVTSYTLKRGATTIYTGAGTSFSDTGLSPATGYSYTVLATNSIGNGPTASASATTSATVPTAPQSFSATAASSSSINLSWGAPSSNGGAAITTYTISRGGTPIHTANGSSTSFTDTGLSAATGYSYTIRANNFVGAGPTASASATTSATVPTAPQSFSATAASSSSINLSWGAPSSNGGATITSYTISRGGTPIHTTANGSVTSFTDTGLAGSTNYSYTVRANNSAGAGATASASATTPASAAPPDAPTITLSGGYTEYTYDENDNINGAYTVWFISSPFTNNNGSAITSSTLVWSGAYGPNSSTQNYPSGESWGPIYISVDYENNDSTFYNVYHTNAAGNSAYSNTVSIST